MSISSQEFLSLIPPEFIPQDESLLQEIKALLSRQPIQRGWWLLCEYKKIWIPLMYLPGLISFQKNFHSRDSDVFIVTYPKCGTTWLKALTFSLLNRNKYSVENENHPLLFTNPHNLVAGLETTLYANPNKVPDFDALFASSQRLLSTHLPYPLLPETIKTNSKVKIVYLWRDPKDVFISLLYFTKTFKIDAINPDSMEVAFDLYCNGVSPCGLYWDHVLEYWNFAKENQDRILFLRYEDLKINPETQISVLAEFLGCPFSEEEKESGVVENIVKLCSFNHLSRLQRSRSEEVPIGMAVDGNVFFRVGEVGDGVKHLGHDMAEIADGITREKFQGTGLII